MTQNTSLNIDEIISKNITVTNDLTVSGVLRANVDINYADFIKKIPLRGISGDLVSGGTIRSFASTGIKDNSTGAVKLSIKDDAVYADAIAVGKLVGSVEVENKLTAAAIDVTGTIKAQRIEVNEIKSDLRIERTSSLEFKNSADNPIVGKGLVWTNSGPTKQFVLKNDNTIFSSENIDLQNGKSFSINGTTVLGENELGPTVVKSRLKEVGTLKSLTVFGNTNLGNLVFVDPTAEKVSIGIEQGNGKFSVVNSGVEFKVNLADSKAYIGTHGYHDLGIGTDDTVRLSVLQNGSIHLGNKNSSPSQVTVYGKLAIGVNSPDANVDLHVNGPIKFQNHLHTYNTQAPESGNYNLGDIVWNTEPRTGQPVGWVCTRAGTPGTWRPFGIIG